MNRGERLAALEGLRGYAALLVFLVHAFGLLAARLYGVDPDRHSVWGDPELARVLLVLLFRSHYGVDLFFVLSGLLMADLAIRRWPGTGGFLARRWQRIYPPYLASGLVVALISWSWFGKTYGMEEVLGNLALLQGFFFLGIPAVNPVTWSLSYEAAFYLAVPALAALWRTRGLPGARLLVPAFVAIIAGAIAVPAEKTVYLAYFALFVPGIALGLLSDRERAALAHRLPLWAAIGAWAGFTLAFKLGLIANTGPAYYFASGLACGLVVLKACDAGGFLGRGLASAVPRWLGRHSYSFFLIHYIVVHRWGAWLADRIAVTDRPTYSLAFLTGSLLISLAAARLLWLAAERFYFVGSRPKSGRTARFPGT